MTELITSTKTSTPKNPFENISYLIVILTWRCPLKCRYCYNGEATSESMSPETLERVFELFSEAITSPFHVQLTGGEPLLEPELTERAVFLTSKIIKGKGLSGSIALQTGGTLIDPNWARFFKQSRTEVGVSLDGPPEVNEKQRGGTRELLKGLETLSSAKVPFNVTTVVTKESVQTLHQIPVLLSSFKSARGLGLDPLVKKGRGLSLPAEPEELALSGRRLKETLKLVNRLRPTPIILRELELLKKAAVKDGGFFCEAHRQRSLAISPDGRLWPCGQAARGGSDLSSGTLDAPHQPMRDFTSQTLKGEQCSPCPLKGKCPGECPSRIYFNQDSSRLVCSLYRSLVDF